MEDNTITVQLNQEKDVIVTLDDVEKFIIKELREENLSQYGYDVYLPTIAKKYAQNELRSANTSNDSFIIERLAKQLSPLFYNAAWNLCVRGIIRPGITKFGEQSTTNGSAGDGYSFTSFGKKWCEESSQDDYIPTAPDRFIEMITPYKELLGAGFFQRSSEAIRSYGAHCYLACCTMTGAAAESIILNLAIKRNGDEAKVLELYERRDGRNKIENLLITGKNSHIQRAYTGYFELLKYWRDQSAHGEYSEIAANEAFTSLALLLRFCAFVKERHEELIEE